ncbi:TetR/AcrR family transcriptional regulator [Puniceicoccaceae bacterium K14]|nr:TetR/AcrR family transcriptional regulator [Puniceicoccaceae bacterium K14]
MLSVYLKTMPAPLKTKKEIQDILVDLFSKFGFDGVSLSLIAKETGLDKGSLYHYYPKGKKEMASCALKSKVSDLASQVLDGLKGTDSTSKAILETFFRALADFYENGRSYCLVGVFPTGSASETLSASLKAAYDAWVDSLTPVLSNHGISNPRMQAISFLAAVQGSLLLEKVETGEALFHTTLLDYAQRWELNLDFDS